MPEPTARDGEIIRLCNRTRALEANGAELLARAKHAEAALERLHSWAGLVSLLDEHWPEDIFPTEPDTEIRDPGPRIVSLLRWVERLRAELALHVGCRVDLSIGDALKLIRATDGPADAPTAVTAATEAHGRAGEAQEAGE